jgi:tripeptide aminopeptidase
MRYFLFTLVSVCLAQTPATLMKDPTVMAALEAARQMEPATIEQQIRICEIPAPSFKEEVRGRELERLF